MLSLNVNGRDHQVDVEPEMPLLWVLREQLGMTGTKFGCGIAQCGACTVHLDGQPVRSCSYPASVAAWKALDVPQCGYCQSGQILAAAALLEAKPKPTDADIDEVMTNICRCGTYQRIRAAIHLAAGTGQGLGSVIHMAGLTADQACVAGCELASGAKA